MKIAVMPGDGIGPEVVAQALKVLQVVAPHAETQEAHIGEAGIQAHGVPLPEPTLDVARKADAILFGAVGVADEADIPRARRPGTGRAGAWPPAMGRLRRQSAGRLARATAPWW